MVVAAPNRKAKQSRSVPSKTGARGRRIGLGDTVTPAQPRNGRTRLASQKSGRAWSGRQHLPAVLAERLERPEARLIGHLLALADPIAEIDVGQDCGARVADQPVHHERSDAALAVLGLEEAVDGGVAVV